MSSPPLALFIVMLPKATWLRIPGCLALGERSYHHDYPGHEDLFCTVAQGLFELSERLWWERRKWLVLPKPNNLILGEMFMISQGSWDLPFKPFRALRAIAILTNKMAQQRSHLPSSPGSKPLVQNQKFYTEWKTAPGPPENSYTWVVQNNRHTSPDHNTKANTEIKQVLKIFLFSTAYKCWYYTVKYAIVFIMPKNNVNALL